jgi:Outer membrane lipoprotein-sorting protein
MSGLEQTCLALALTMELEVEDRWPMVTKIVKWGLNRAPFLVVLSLVALVVSASAQTQSSAPNVETITSHMAQAQTENQARFRPYIVTRDYKMFGKDRPEAKSEVTANITFAPPNLKTYTVQHAAGSGLGETIVRRMLEGEIAMTKKSSATDISEDNYNFRFVREEDVDGKRCHVLEMLPRRKDKNLLRGSVWVDANTYLLRRAEGSLAMSPSWWVRNVNIVLLFGDAGGMWLQTGLEATANVRILGQATVISHDVSYEIREVVAVNVSTSR